METFLTSMIELLNLSIHFIGLDDRIKAIGHIEKYGLDFEDSMTLQAAAGSGCTHIVSFDNHFDDVPIKRVEPKDLIKESILSCFTREMGGKGYFLALITNFKSIFIIFERL